MGPPRNIAPIYFPLFRPRSPSVTLHRAYNRSALERFGGRRGLLALSCLLWPARATAVIWKRTRRHGAYVKRLTGKSVLRQWIEQLKLVFGYGLPPGAYVLYQLYYDEQWPLATEYLHRFETKDYLFRFLNRRSDRTLVNDKQRFFEFCRDHDLRTATVLASFPRDATTHLSLPACDLLSKPRGGKGGRSVVRWRFDGATYRSLEDDQRYTAEELVKRLEESSSDDEPLLLQVAENNHPEIDDLGRGVLTTARIMTCRRVDGEVEACSAVLRVPTVSVSVDNLHAGGIATSIDMTTGRLSTAISLRPRSPRHAHVPNRPDVPIEGRIVPRFQDALELVVRAHRALPDYVIVGWDVGFTADGPCLIEANRCPCVEAIQRPPATPIGVTRLGQILREHISVETQRGGISTSVSGGVA